MSTNLDSVPEGLTPEQFFERKGSMRYLESEQRLMVAILRDAIECLQKHVHTQDIKGRRIFLDAQEWLIHEDSEWPFSFFNCCAALGMNAEYIRDGLTEWLKREQGRKQEERSMRKKSFGRHVGGRSRHQITSKK